MKIVIAVALLLFVGLVDLSEAQNQNRQESDLVKGRAGFMVVGKSLYDGLSPVDEVELNDEAGVVEIRRGGKLFIRLEVKMEMFASLDYMVKTITVFDQKFKTALGVGVGSSFADIRTKHSDAQLEKTADGRQVAVVGDLSMYFWMEQAKSPSSRSLMILSRDFDSVECSDQDLKVTSITVF